MTDQPGTDAPTPADDPAAKQRSVSGFRRLALILIGSLGVVAAVAAGTAFALYRSATATVPEYEAALEIDPVTAEADRREFESQLTALASDAQSLPEWTSRVTARQINAWLAVRLERDFPGFKRAGLLSPRVVLREDEILVAARSVLTRVHGVLALTLRPMVTEDDELALQVASARLGALPLPLEALMAQLKETPLTEIGPIRLAQSSDTATIVLDLERLNTSQDLSVRLTGVDVRPGELLLRGESTGGE
ncbi:hypothetical protein MalM25_08680 [Planctomycetes bacterium MalM25]|nr:hypothetical protein MalM25_08680 [Planctomycetes bacterium MalM25]